MYNEYILEAELMRFENEEVDWFSGHTFWESDEYMLWLIANHDIPIYDEPAAILPFPTVLRKVA